MGDEEEKAAAMISSFTVKETGRNCQLLWIPEGTTPTDTKLTSIVQDIWGFKEDEPNNMISCDAGTVHPKMFASPDLCELHNFRVFWEDAQKHAKDVSGVTDGEANIKKARLVIVGCSRCNRTLI